MCNPVSPASGLSPPPKTSPARPVVAQWQGQAPNHSTKFITWQLQIADTSLQWKICPLQLSTIFYLQAIYHDGREGHQNSAVNTRSINTNGKYHLQCILDTSDVTQWGADRQITSRNIAETPTVVSRRYCFSRFRHVPTMCKLVQSVSSELSWQNHPHHN